jgi:hypothetical protein
MSEHTPVDFGDEPGLPERVVGQDLSTDLAAGSKALSRHIPRASPPVPAQLGTPALAAELQSEKIVVAAPMSFAGSSIRIWKLTRLSDQTPARIGLGALAVLLIALAWVLVLAWYMTWGLLLVPYRVIRRGSRKRKREALQHREMMAAIQGQQNPTRRLQPPE